MLTSSEWSWDSLRYALESEGEMSGEPHKITGKIEQRRCYITVAFGAVTAKGHTMRLPPYRVALDIFAPGITITAQMAKELGVEIKPVQNSKGNGSPLKEVGVGTIYFCVYDDAEEIAWEQVADVRILLGNEGYPPSIGMGQLLNWKLALDGPAGTFELTIPPQSSQH